MTMTIDRLNIRVGGTDLEMRIQGHGRPMLFLHGGEGPDVTWNGVLARFGQQFRVYAPCHPGFGAVERPSDIRDISDLAYLYLDLAEMYDLSGAIFVAASFGAWIAAEIAIRDSSRFSHLILSGPLGIKVRGREARDIEDIFAMSHAEYVAAAYADPKNARLELAEFNDEQLKSYFGAWESLAFFAWKPYMHNPQLRRWLHRIRIPTAIIAGKEDRLVFDGYYEAYNKSIPSSKLLLLDDAGHFPHVEQCELFVRAVNDFVTGTGTLSPSR